jgi:Ca2+-binding RTX toxin-like protein
MPKIEGTPGDDTLAGTSGNDTMTGLDGADRLSGGAGFDLIRGGRGDDWLYGDDGADRLFGDQDNDVLEGGLGDDSLVGGDGADTLIGGNGFDTLEGGAGNDALRSGDGASTLLGGDGDDSLFADGATSDAVYDGGAGADRISLALPSGSLLDLSTTERQTVGGKSFQLIDIESVMGPFGDSTIIGSSADNELDGGGRLEGRDGNDRFQTHLNETDQDYTDDVTCLGGAGDDYAEWQLGDLVFDGGEGSDTFALPISGFFSLSDSSEHEVVEGLTFRVMNIENLLCGGGEDTIHGTSAANRIDGGDGGDWLVGFAGADRLEGGGGMDVVEGGGDNDRITDRSGIRNVLRGDDGQDTLTGGTGDDTLDGGSGLDWVDFSAATSATVVDLGLTVGQYTNAGAGRDKLVAIEGLLGSAFADTLTGSERSEILYGLDNRDSLSGGGGSDTLNGGGKKDVIVGGEGADFLTGGGGKDWFVYRSAIESVGRSRDLIYDLAKGDRIDLSAIDANIKKAGDQSFVLASTFTGPGQAVLSYDMASDLTSLTLYANGDSRADGLITMAGDQTSFHGFVL